MNQPKRNQYVGCGGPASDPNKVVALLYLLIFATVCVTIGLAIRDDNRAAWAQKQEWVGFAARNPQVQIVAVSQGQYGPEKWHDGQIIVEVKGTTSSETRVIREKDDHVRFNHVPNVGETWRTWVTNDEGAKSSAFTFHMEPLGR